MKTPPRAPTSSHTNLRRIAILGIVATSVVAPSVAVAQPLSFVDHLGAAIELVRAQLESDSPMLEVPTAEAMQIGKPTFLADQWFKVTDEFEEACGLGSLRIETGSNNNFTTITRGKAKYVTPFNDPNDAHGGRFDWKCGNNLEHSECSDSPNGADHIRVYWESNTRNIQIKCFERCGDGTSQSDC